MVSDWWVSLFWAKCQVTKNPFHILRSCLLHQLAVDWRKNRTKTEATAAEQPRWPGNFSFSRKVKRLVCTERSYLPTTSGRNKTQHLLKTHPIFQEAVSLSPNTPQNFLPCDASPGSSDNLTSPSVAFSAARDPSSWASWPALPHPKQPARPAGSVSKRSL